MRKYIVILILVVMAVLSVQQIYAAEIDGQEVINSQIDNLNLGEIDKIIGGMDTDSNGISIEDLARQAIEGKLDLSPQSIIKTISKSFFGEFITLASLVRNMILIAILGAFLNNLSLSLNKNHVSELGFYMCYLTIIIILISSFNICSGVMISFINDLCSIMQASLPVVLTLMAMSGNVGSAYVFSPIMAFIINALALFVRDIITPVLIFTAVLQLINYISEKEILQKLATMLKKCTGWAMKGMTLIFVAILSLHALSTPIVNTAVTKTAKATLNIVPVVGQALNGAVDMVTYWTSAVKSGVMTAFIISILMICAVPVLKLIAFIAVFKFSAAIIQPVSDPRIVKAIDSIGSITAVLLGACVCTIFMFVFMVMVTLSI